MQLPFLNISYTFHVGTLNRNLKQLNSCEGAGLSVSNCPSVWMKITRFEPDARVIGLENLKGKFLNFYDLSEIQLNEIRRWGVENGYLVPYTIYRYTYYDSEFECDMIMSFTDKERALQELCDESHEQLEEVDSFVGTSKLAHAQFQTDSTSIDPIQILTIQYIEENYPDFDGVWFDEDLDIYRLSAPRGVIFNNRLDNWIVHTKWDDEYLYDIQQDVEVNCSEEV